MPIDASIPLGYQQPNGLQSLSNLIGVKTALQQQQLQQQQMQSNAMANQQSQYDLQETQNARALMQNIKHYQDDQGNIDLNKIAPDLIQAAPKNGAQWLANLAAAQQAHSAANNAVMSVDANARGQLGQLLYSLKGQPADVVGNTIEQVTKAYPMLDKAKQFFLGQLSSAEGQAGIDDLLDRSGKMMLSPPQQQEMNTPAGVVVNDSQTSQVTSIKPGTSVKPGMALPGTKVQIQLPPTQPTISPSGQPGVIGPQSGGEGSYPIQPGDTIDGIQSQIDAVRSNGGQPINKADQPAIDREVARLQQKLQGMQGGAQASRSGFTPTALPPGQANNIQNNFDEMNRHFAGLNDASTGNPLVASLTGNIKSLATKAVTGTESDKLAYANGLLAHLPGFTGQPSTDLKTATDLLEKNMTQLNLNTPASSDAARSLVSAARPNSHMTTPAIVEAAEQVASQVQANMAIRNALQGYKTAGDVQGYMKARTQLEKIADPRIWQYESIPDAGARKKFMSSLSHGDQKSLIDNAQQLEKMGLIK